MTTSHPPERAAAVTFRGTPMTLVGPALRVGDPAPEFTLTTGTMGQFTLNEALDGGTRSALLIVVPSLDTPVCHQQTKKFEDAIVASDFIEKAPVSEQVREKICYRNAQRVLKIS